MAKRNITQSRQLCEEISFGKYIFSNIYIIESYVNGILDSILIPSIKWVEENFSPKMWDNIVVKYSAKVQFNTINAYMADIAFAEITNTGNLKLNIEPSGFHPTMGSGIYQG